MKDDDTLYFEVLRHPRREWPLIWCLLNTWVIPEGMTKPDWWESDKSKRSEYITKTMNKIVFLIGKDTINKYWVRHFTTIGSRERRNIWMRKHKIISKLLV